MTEKVPANREEQIRKLPVWVRNMLAAKDREIADRDKLLAELSTTAPGIAVRDRHKVAIPVAFDRYGAGRGDKPYARRRFLRRRTSQLRSTRVGCAV